MSEKQQLVHIAGILDGGSRVRRGQEGWYGVKIKI